ncbi:hypothetical protein F5882DRAFT_96032 [Hyaloscypha sp. PMI_1271]|nr:hypothetical protein F5882DRAFT_96032 [Hyaloscypha sp. PMI_1271]
MARGLQPATSAISSALNCLLWFIALINACCDSAIFGAILESSCRASHFRRLWIAERTGGGRLRLPQNWSQLPECSIRPHRFPQAGVRLSYVTRQPRKFHGKNPVRYVERYVAVCTILYIKMARLTQYAVLFPHVFPLPVPSTGWGNSISGIQLRCGVCNQPYSHSLGKRREALAFQPHLPSQ